MSRPHRRPHRARHLAVQLADGVDRAGRSERQRRHVELRAAAVVVGAEREEPVAIRAERAPAAGEMLLDEVERKRVVAGRHRRVRREHRGRADLARARRRTLTPLLDQIADALQHDEAGVPFVEVEHAGLDAERLQRADAADAEHDLLLDARLAVAAVEPRRQLAIPRARSLRGRCRADRASPGRAARARPRRAPMRSPSGTAVMHGLPSGVIAGSIGASAQFSRS